MNRNFKAFNEFWGFGNPHTDLWFIGIEESSGEINSKNLSAKVSERKNLRLYLEEPEEYPTEWFYFSRTAKSIFGDKIDPQVEGEFVKHMFSEDHSIFFSSYLFPIPKSSSGEWPDSYQKFFGYSSGDYWKYISDVREFRYPVIYELWNTYKPKAVVMYGKSHWHEHMNLLKLGHSPFEVYEEGNIIYYPKYGLILTPYLGFGQITGSIMKKIEELIRESLVRE